MFITGLKRILSVCLFFIIVAVSLPAAVSAATAGLVAYYPFDGDVQDHSGNGRHATNTGGTYIAGISGKAMRFDGQSFVSAPVNINPSVMPRMTMTAWVRSARESGTVISQDDGGFDRTIDIDTRGGGVGWSCFSGSQGVVGYSKVALEAWTFLAAVYNQDEETVKLYVDDAVFEGEGSLGEGWDLINIGRNPSYGGNFVGVIDDVRIYNYALSTSELKSLKSSQTPYTPGSITSPVAYYPFDGDVQDHSGNGYHGANTGASFVSGVSGQALQFDGQKAFVSAPVNINPWNMPRLTMTAWVMSEREDAGTVICQDDGGFDRTIDIDTRGGGLGWSCFIGSQGVLGYRKVELEKWTFLAAVYDQTTGKVKLYVDNNVFEGNGISDWGWSLINIGRSPSYGGYFNGKIDEVRIYDYALSASEIKSLKSEVVPPVSTPSATPTATSTPRPTTTAQPTPTATGTISAGSIAYYPFNGDVKDYSGSGLHGTNSGAVFVSGKSGQALKFDGQSNFVSAPVNINPEAMPRMTMTAWVKSDVESGGTVISQDDGGFDRTIDIDTRGGGLGWSCFSGTGGVLGFRKVETGKWTFVAAVYDQPAGKVRLYVDDAAFEQDAKLDKGWDYINIGRNPSYGGVFSGLIDEVRIFNYALSAAEIGSLRSGTLPPSSTPSTTPSATSTPTPAATGTISAGSIAYYPFNGDVKDYSGSGLHATNSGATFVAGKSGQALKFDGQSSFVSSPININPDVMPRMSVTAWVMSEREDGGTVISHDDGGYDRTICIDTRGGGLGWSCFSGSEGALGFRKVETGKWTFLAAVYDQPAGKVRLYVDDAVFEENGKLDKGVDHINIGRNPSYGGVFNGVIDEVRIFNYALSAAEIGSLRSGALPPTSTPAATSTPSPAATSAPPATPGVASIVADSRSVPPGGTVQVPVRLENVKNIGSMNFVLTYDPKIVEVNKVDKGSLLSSAMFAPNFEEPPVVRFGFADKQGVSGSGSVAYIEFKAIGSAGSSSPLTLSEIIAEDGSGNPVSLKITNGTVSIKGKSDRLLGDYNGDGKVTEVDALAALRMSVKLLAEDLIVDMDQNGKVTAEDARLILVQAVTR
jgi:hypothetical protein